MLQGFCFLNHKHLQASFWYLQGAEPANMGPANTCPAGSWLLGLMAMNASSQQFPRCCDRGNLVSPGITQLPLVPLLRFPSNPPSRRCNHGNIPSYVSIYASHNISSIDPPPTYHLHWGKGALTQQAHGEFIVSSETICLPNTQWVHGEYL